MRQYFINPCPDAAMHRLTRDFTFEAAHTLVRMIGRKASLRTHGHSYHVRVFIEGEPDPATGMLIDGGHLKKRLKAVKKKLCHHDLDTIEGLGPATLENLAAWIFRKLEPKLVGLVAVKVWRPTERDSATYWP